MEHEITSTVLAAAKEPTPEELAAAAPEKAKRQERYKVDASGVYWRAMKDDGSLGEWVWQFPYLEALAIGRDGAGDNFSLLLRFRNLDGRERDFIMPMKMLAGDGLAIREMLLSMGYPAPPTHGRANDPLLKYLREPVEARFRTVARVGWHGPAFVLPDRSFGLLDSSERTVYDASQGAEHAYHVSGSLEEWQATIGAWAVGNSRLAFAISAAFAAPLMEIVGEQSGGFHLNGRTSTGKTSAVMAAASVWGGKPNQGAGGYVQQWRVTDNGLEEIAAGYCDGLLCLDELSQADPKHVGEIIYMLGNGRGKGRANKGGGARKVAQWRTLVLSNGERSPAEHMQEAGKRAMGGQEVRMADIPFEVDTGVSWEKLHDFKTPKEFSEEIQRAARQNFGHAIRVYLEKLAELDRVEVDASIRRYRALFLADHVPEGAASEVGRVASRFALAGAAGEMAIGYGVLPWPPGEAIDAASLCFAAWLAARKTSGSSDTERGIAQVRKFLATHGSSRFESFNGSGGDRPIINRAGFREDVPGYHSDPEASIYYILADHWREEVCQGFNAKTIARALADRGHLVRQGDNQRLTVERRFPEVGQTRAYGIRSSIFGDGDAC